MSSLLTVNTARKPRRGTPDTVAPDVDADVLVDLLEQGFETAVAHAIQEAHAAGVAVPVLDAREAVVWLEPTPNEGKPLARSADDR